MGKSRGRGAPSWSILSSDGGRPRCDGDGCDRAGPHRFRPRDDDGTLVPANQVERRCRGHLADEYDIDIEAVPRASMREGTNRGWR